jgi:D-cysteine desulfhydrase
VNYPSRLSLAQLPTPLQQLGRLGNSIDFKSPRIWVKRDDLTGCATSGNKVRKLEFTLAEARERGCDTLITCGGLQSNHCRSTAILGAQLGFRVHLLLRGLPEGCADGNLFLDQLAGAEISYFETCDYQKNLGRLLAECADSCRRQGRNPMVIPTGASDGIGVWGYIAACEELKQDFADHGISPGHIVCATGSGGTQAGLTAGCALFDLPARVWGVNVCDDEQYFLNKVRADLDDWKTRYAQSLDTESLAVRVIDGYVGPGYAIATEPVFDTIAMLARAEGIILDPVYTGKAFHGMLEEIRKGRFDDCDDLVFVHTGGLFGLLAQRNEFRNSG